MKTDNESEKLEKLSLFGLLQVLCIFNIAILKVIF